MYVEGQLLAIGRSLQISVLTPKSGAFFLHSTYAPFLPPYWALSFAVILFARGAD